MDLPVEETHPSFGWAQANTVQSSGSHLFDSEIRHQQFVMLRIGRAARSREINRDWIRETSEPGIVEIQMSMAQWGALVSSFGSSGVPVTISRVDGERIEQPEHEPRLGLSAAEVKGSVDKLMETIEEKTAGLAAAFEAKAGRRELAALIRDLTIAVGNAGPNAKYAADTFTEHVENVVTKARYDIEATARMAAESSLQPGVPVLALGPTEGP